MEMPHQKIRQARLEGLKEPMRSIASSNFAAIPRLEARYYEYISNDFFYRDLHERWVLGQLPLPPIPTENELYRLREDILGIRGISEPEKVKLNDPLFALLIDIAMPFLDNLMKKTLSYYSLTEKTGEEISEAMQHAAFSALLICDPKHVQKEGYPYFINAFTDAFKFFFSKEIGAADAPLPVDDAAFLQAVEQEWQKLLPYSDSLYGFEVVPKIGHEEMLRYLKLPFADKSYRRLPKGKTYQQINNYVVALATFKPVPDFHLRVYMRQEICALYLPLVEKIAKREVKKKSQKFSLDQIKAIIVDEIPKAAADFDYFYTTKKNLTRGKVSSSREMIFPLNKSFLAKLGHLFSGDEFPFTDFLQQRLTTRMRKFFAENLPRSPISIDDEIRDNEGERVGTIADVVADDETQVDRKKYFPAYDAPDRDGNKIGWRRDTFAGIIGKGRDTLIRWDKEGLLVPKRYPIYSLLRKRQIPYRVYTIEDVPKAKEVEVMKNKLMRHQK